MKAFPGWYPKSAVLELTYRCNHFCKFCSCPWENKKGSYPKGIELSGAEWCRVIDKLYAIGVKTISISGGESLLYKDLPIVLEHLYLQSGSLGLPQSFVLISNGLLMNEDYLKLFKKFNVHLSMSLPGFNNFKKLTGVDNAENVLYWFQRAKALGLKTTCNVTVTNLNISELYETLALALLNGASSILLNRFLPGGRGLAFMDELLLSNDQVNEMLDVAEEVLSESRRYGHVGTEIPLCIIKDPSKYKHLSIGYKCAAAKEFFVIDPAGQVRCCNHSPVVVGNIFDDDIISNQEYWRIFSNSDYHPSFCKKCTNIHKCDCGCREVAAILNKAPCDIDGSIDFSSIKRES